ncbi:MAG: ParB/RepB/Spo0J family partition protein [Rhizobiaceae bacterium]|nr:ParB/RepB/Spo0J family partition protein [Rhizobiaceae bacterium]
MAEDSSKSRLGRGLAALIGEMDQPSTSIGKSSAEGAVTQDQEVPIELIRANPQNPRRHFNDAELADLSNSIKEHGIVQPILVRPIKNEDLGGARYEIIAGERRWRASQRAGLHAIPVVIRDVDDRHALELAIIENVQRADLNAIEEAMGYQQLINDYDYSQAELGKVLSLSRSHVANTLRLLKLPEEVMTLVAEGKLSAGHARTLVNATGASFLADKIIREGLSVRQAEQLAQNPEEATKKSSGKPAPKNADIAAVEARLEEKLGFKTSLKYKDNGAGSIRISFKNLDQLDSICKLLESGNQ